MLMQINLVAAASENNVIGKDNALLWNLPNDLAFFKNVTWGMPVIMGRKTFESMKGPLKGRTNIVVTRTGMPQTGGPAAVTVTPSLDKAIEAAGATDARECYVIGGGEIYRLALPLADQIYLTRVHANFEGDTYFPEFDKKEWSLIRSDSFEADQKHQYAYTFQTWQKSK